MKSKIENFIRRTLPILTVVVVLLCCLISPVSAADFSDKQWSDFPFTSTTVGGAVNYTIDFSSGGNYTIRRWSPFQEIELGADPSFLIELSGTYTLVYYTSVFEYDTLFFTGAESSFSFAYEFYGGYHSLDFTDSYVYVLCFDADGDYLTTELFEASYDSSMGLYTAHFVPRVPSGTVYVQLASALYFRIEIITEENEATPVVFPISTFDYSFSLPVDSVQNQQIQQKLDSIFNGTPEQNESANSAAGILGDKGEQLGSLAGAIQPEKPNLDSVNMNVGDLVPDSGLNTLTSAISPIANNDLVIKLLVMVATLILVSYVLFGKKG